MSGTGEKVLKNTRRAAEKMRPERGSKADPAEAKRLQESAAAAQREKNRQSREGIKSSVSGLLNEPWSEKQAAHKPGVTKSDVVAKQSAKEREEQGRIRSTQEAADAAKTEKSLSRRAGTADFLRNQMPRPPAAAFVEKDEDEEAAKAQKAGTITQQTTRTGTQLSDETLRAEEHARASAYTAAVEKSRIDSEYAGLAGETIEELAANVQDANDEVHQLWEAANAKQQARTQAIEEMIDAGRKNLADPTAFFGSNKAAAGFGAGMAVAAGHLASALGGGPNTALKIIDKAIERQLRADEFNISQATIRDQQSINLLDKWRQVTKDQVEARTLAKLNLIQQAEFAVEAQALRQESEMAKQNLQAVKSALLTQKAELMRRHDELQKRSSSMQISRIIPMAVQDRDERLAEEAAAAQPQPSAVATETGTASALVSALGGRATYDTGATLGEGVPSSIASPELIEEEGAPFRPVGVAEIYNTAATQAEGNERQTNRAGGQAVLDAGKEELQALWARGVTDPVELEEAWRQSPVLQATYPDPDALTPRKPFIESGQYGLKFYEVREPPSKLTGETYSEALNTVTRGTDYINQIDQWQDEVNDLRRALGGATRRDDGTIDIDRLDTDLRRRVLQFQHIQDEAFSIVRTANKSGALQGPGEAQLFKEMSLIADTPDKIVDALLGESNLEANLTVQREMIEKHIKREANKIGLASSDSFMADPDDVGDQLRADSVK